jgi:hypothetical protein
VRLNEDQIRKSIRSQRQGNSVLEWLWNGLGIRMDVPRECGLFFLAPIGSDVRALAEALETSGLCTVEVVLVTPNQYCVQGVVVATPQSVCGDAVTEKLIRLAAEHGAIYDGCDTTLTEAEQRKCGPMTSSRLRALSFT